MAAQPLRFERLEEQAWSLLSESPENPAPGINRSFSLVLQPAGDHTEVSLSIFGKP
jgi:hypothetical protein